MKIISWNVNGIRAAAKKGLIDWFEKERPDILCIQETKIQDEQISDELRKVTGYHSYWSFAEKKGYSGVVTYSSSEPAELRHGFGMEKRFDSEGRIVAAEYPEFILFNIYFPNGKMSEERLQYKLDFYDAALEHFESLRKKGKSLVICGDFNTAHNEIDLARPQDNEQTSGFLRIERDWMDKLEDKGYIDTFRKLHPDTRDAYSWWSMRARARERNVGWRLDYFYISPDIFNKVRRAEIMQDVKGSDHCPVLLEIH